MWRGRVVVWAAGDGHERMLNGGVAASHWWQASAVFLLCRACMMH